MYILKKIKDKEKWNDFIINSDFEFFSFLQSWEWWELQKVSKKNIKRYWIYKNHQKKEKLIWIFQMIEIRAKRWSYYLIPHGPLIKNLHNSFNEEQKDLSKNEKIKQIDKNNYFEVLKNILPFLKKEAKLNKIDFIRINSTVKNLIENKIEYKKLWFIDAPMHEHAEDTHLLDLEDNTETIFNNIKKKDRYYINRAIKEWVKVRIDNKKDHVEKLISMHHDHANKVWYQKFSKEFVYNLYEVFGDNISTISTSYNQNIESILMTIRFWKTCVYYIASSDIIHHKFSPNYLCQWEAIKKAKNDGAFLYNFWWVSPDDNLKHPIAWVTRFKRKFWWYDYSLLHAQDLVISWRYCLNWVVESFRRVRRGYYYRKPE